ncbi:hypothetical protein PEDI_55410 [Persicobacter diffluens]|uniref:Uncharacterized protein n=1 Tax=Persicobacter diffluens TaxID=981 RepID=A0AAN5AN02_9BACT|nr:hypothetical protein PEDI_55410 [Persicobacter diffluens]
MMNTTIEENNRMKILGGLLLKGSDSAKNEFEHQNPFLRWRK